MEANKKEFLEANPEDMTKKELMKMLNVFFIEGFEPTWSKPELVSFFREQQKLIAGTTKTQITQGNKMQTLESAVLDDSIEDNTSDQTGPSDTSGILVSDHDEELMSEVSDRMLWLMVFIVSAVAALILIWAQANRVTILKSSPAGFFQSLAIAMRSMAKKVST